MTRHHLKGPSPGRVALAGAAAVMLLVGELVTPDRPPLLLANDTPSEPPGLYLRTTQTPRVGAIVAFHIPRGGLAYVSRARPVLRSRPLLKAVAAGPGDVVCTRGYELSIDGRPVASIARRDRSGGALPHWLGCRSLRSDELFVFSARVPNSFDSRYFGPVSSRAVLGVYRGFPIATRAVAQ